MNALTHPKSPVNTQPIYVNGQPQERPHVDFEQILKTSKFAQSIEQLVSETETHGELLKQPAPQPIEELLPLAHPIASPVPLKRQFLELQSPEHTPVTTKHRKTGFVPPPATQFEETIQQVLFDVPPYHNMSREMRIVELTKLTRTANKLKSSGNSNAKSVPEIVQNIRPEYLRGLYIQLKTINNQRNVDNYVKRMKVGVVGALGFVETAAVSFGLPVADFSKYTVEGDWLHYYDDALEDMAQTVATYNVGSGVTGNMKPVPRMLALTALNLVGMAGINLLGERFGKFGEMFLDFLLNLFFGAPDAGKPQRPKVEAPDPYDIEVAKAPKTKFFGMEATQVIAQGVGSYNSMRKNDEPTTPGSGFQFEPFKL